MYTLIKVFVKQKGWKLCGLACTTAIIGLLLFYAGVLRQTLDDRIIVNEIGAIPSVTIRFEPALNRKEINNLMQAMQEKIEIDYLRKGYIFNNDNVSFKWNKAGDTIWTKFNLDRIGWDLEQKVYLLVESEGKEKKVPCLRMDPVYDGFIIPEEYVKDIGNEIKIKKAFVKATKQYVVNMNLPAVLRNKSITIDNQRCRSYSYFRKGSRGEYRKTRAQYYQKISKCLSAHLGSKMWRTLHKNTKKNIFRLYMDMEEKIVAVPSLQIWEDLCGTSLQYHAAYKDIEIKEFINGNEFKYDMEFYGYYQTKYRDDVNGYVLICNLDWLMKYLGKSENIYNLLEIEIPASVSDDDLLSKLAGILKKEGFSDGSFEIIPWWELADRKSVDFIRNIKEHLKWFSWLMFAFGLFAFIQTCNRFAEDINSKWDIFRILGAKIIHLFIIYFAHVVIIVSGGLFIAYVLALLLNKLVLDNLLPEPVSMVASTMLQPAILIVVLVIIIYMATSFLHHSNNK